LFLWCGLVTLEILAVTSLPADAEKSLLVTVLDRAIREECFPNWNRAVLR
jgi:hypothetical protein